MHSHTLTLDDAQLCLVIRGLSILTTDDLEDRDEIEAVRAQLPVPREYTVEKLWLHKARDDAHRSTHTISRFDHAVKCALADNNDPYRLDEATVRDKASGEVAFVVSPAGR